MNHLYRGQLPECFKDLTWLEEQVCALAHPGHNVFCPYFSNDPQQPYLAKGNCCVHPQPTRSTAQLLPLLPTDMNNMLGVIFTSSLSKMPKNILKNVFRVRKPMILDFLTYLSQVNPLYANIEINDSNLAEYPNDDMLPGIDNHVILNQVPNPSEMFEEETAAFEPHPASTLNKNDGHSSVDVQETIHIENVGLCDANGKNDPAHFLKASALTGWLKCYITLFLWLITISS